MLTDWGARIENGELRFAMMQCFTPVQKFVTKEEVPELVSLGWWVPYALKSSFHCQVPVHQLRRSVQIR